MAYHPSERSCLISSHTASRRTIATVFAASLLAAATATLVATHPGSAPSSHASTRPAAVKHTATLTARSDVLLEIDGPKAESADQL